MRLGLEEAEHFLDKHRAESFPNVYFIQRSGSFREQMGESVTFIRAAFRTKVFRESSTLLVIGGGVSGLAAGLEAAGRGMLVTLIESKAALLSVQRNCATRYLHPHEYKWPHAHYTETFFPFLKDEKLLCPAPLRWKAGVASEVVKKMSTQVESEAPSNLDLNLNFRHIPISLKNLRTNFDPEGEFDFILICAGAQEETRLGKFAGFRYWEKDHLEDLSSRKWRHKVKKVLISGGGDGGLQDLLRIIHRPQPGKLFSAGKLLKELLPFLNRSPQFVAWIRKKQKDPQANRPVPANMWSEINELLDSMEQDKISWKAISRSLLARIDPIVIKEERHVQLVFRDPIFSHAYALNAFLVHLLTRVLKKRTWLLPNCELSQIVSSSKGHRCSENAKECCGRPHKIILRDSKNKTREHENVDLIVIRHGSKQAVPNSPNKPKSGSRSHITQKK